MTHEPQAKKPMKARKKRMYWISGTFNFGGEQHDGFWYIAYNPRQALAYAQKTYGKDNVTGVNK